MRRKGTRMELLQRIALMSGFVLTIFPLFFFYRATRLGMSLKNLQGSIRRGAENQHQRYLWCIGGSLVSALLLIELVGQYRYFVFKHLPNWTILRPHLFFAIFLFVLLGLIRWRFHGNNSRLVHRIAVGSAFGCYLISLVLGLTLMYTLWAEI